MHKFFNAQALLRIQTQLELDLVNVCYVELCCAFSEATRMVSPTARESRSQTLHACER